MAVPPRDVDRKRRGHRPGPFPRARDHDGGSVAVELLAERKKMPVPPARVNAV